MLSKKSKYALKALILLSNKYEEGPILIADIAKHEKIPKKFLEAILLELRKKGILASKKGAGGGYYMLKSPKNVMLSDVIRITDGPIALTPCVSLNFYERCEECINEEVCSIKDFALKVRDASLNILSKTSLGDLVAREQILTKNRKRMKK